jgi:hypothetical protein
MRKRYYTTVVVLMLLVTTGCAHYGALEEDYGKSYRAALDGQTLNPAASKNLEPVTGLNGKAMEAVMNKYIESFSKKGYEQPAQQGFILAPAGTTGTDTYGK